MPETGQVAAQIGGEAATPAAYGGKFVVEDKDSH